MERPEYDGIKFYSSMALSNGSYYEKTVELLEKLDMDEEYYEINQLIEIFEIYQIIDAYSTRNCTNIIVKEKAKKALGIAAKFFKKISDDNFFDTYNNVCMSYIGEFWKLVDKFKPI